MKILLSIFCALAILPMTSFADTFEFISFTPPAGWNKQMTTDGVVYRRANGIGLISLYSSQPSTGTAEQEFAKMWRVKIETPLSIKAPQPKLEADGNFIVGVGAQNVDAQGTLTSISLVTIVGRGRVLGVSTVSAGDDVMREMMPFLDSIKISGSAGPQMAAGSNSLEVDFDVPPGYTMRREGPVVMLQPTAMNDKTPCVYGFIPTRATLGSLPTDAQTSLVQAFPGWQIKNDRFNAMRGTSADGWQYYWFRTDIQRLVGGSYEYATAMTMAFPGATGQVNILWGFGSTAKCLADDVTFARLFHSLRPRGWTSDGGNALARDLIGTWRNSQSVGMAQYKFAAGRRYEYGLGTITRMGVFETTTSSASDGRFELRGGQLIVTPNIRGRSAQKYRVRIYDEFVTGRWTRAMSLLDDSPGSPLEVQYMKVD